MDLQAQLIQAIEDKNLRMIKALVDSGADLNEPYGPIGTAPFIFAMNYFKKGEQVEQLIDMGGDVNSKNDHGETPLMIAVEEGKCDSILPWLFVDCGLKSLDDQDISGNTALMKALLDGHIKSKKDLIFSFIDYGADLTNLKNKRGLTAFDILWSYIIQKI